jgi:site-specific recombinase XerC
MFEALTPDNPSLSRLTSRHAHISISEIDFTLGADIAGPARQIDPKVAALVENSLSPNTRRAYLSDLAHAEACGASIPATPEQIASYLAAHAGLLSVATLVRRVASISKAHEARGFPNPCRSEIVRATLRGIKRTRGTAQHQAKPLLRGDLILVLERLGDSLKDVRDRALLLIGFAGGFRRSELVGLDFGDIEHVRQGLVITLRRSKTDQEGAGRKIGIPHGRTRHCPVEALAACRAGFVGGVYGTGSLCRGEACAKRLIARVPARAPCLIR